MIAKNKDFAKKRFGEVISRLNEIGAHIIAQVAGNPPREPE
jgi:hypothetical protein